MSAKNRKQLVILNVLDGRIPFLPKGSYQVYIMDTKIVGGSIELTARILSSSAETEVGKDG